LKFNLIWTGAFGKITDTDLLGPGQNSVAADWPSRAVCIKKHGFAVSSPSQSLQFSIRVDRSVLYPPAFNLGDASFMKAMPPTTGFSP
jgi:hypothetical protein